MTTPNEIQDLITNINAEFPYAKVDNSSAGFRDNFHYIKFALDALNHNLYPFPTATDGLLGGVKVGYGLAINSYTGVLSVNQTIASTTNLGFIKIGTGLRTDPDTGVTTLTPATTSEIGGVKSDGYTININSNGIITATGQFTGTVLCGDISSAGNGVFAGGGTFGSDVTSVGNIRGNDGIFSGNLYAGSVSFSGSINAGLLTGSSTGYTVNFNTLTNQLLYVPETIFSITPATTSTLGSVKIGVGVSVDSSGTISVNTGTPYVLPPATYSALGGVVVGSGLYVDGNGILSVVNTAFNGGLINQPLLIDNFTQSYSTGSGALIVEGGVGINKTLWVGEVSVVGNEFVGGQLFVQSTIATTSATSGALQVKGGVGIGGNVVLAGYLKTVPTTVDALPSASLVGAGARAFVTDSTVTTFMAIVVNGGFESVPVFSNGTNWLVG